MIVVDFVPTHVAAANSPVVPSVVGDVLGGLVVLALFVILVTIGVWRSSHRGYFVTFSDSTSSSQVLILHGKPGGRWWFDPEIASVTPLTRSSLLPAFVADIERVRAFDSLDEARRFIAALEKVTSG